MPNKLERLSSDGGRIEITTNPATTALIPYGAVSGGILRILLAFPSSNTLTWMIADGPNDAATSLYDNGNLVQTHVSGAFAYPFPDACYAARYIRIVCSSGSITATYSVKG